MATTQNSKIGITEGIIYIFGKASEAVEAGAAVALDTTSGYPYFKNCGTSGVPFGVCAQKVTANGVADYEPGGLVSHTAKVGDYVGVYVCGGIYNIPATSACTYGSVLYAGVGTAGTYGVSASSDGTKVGVCCQAVDSTGYAKMKLLV